MILLACPHYSALRGSLVCGKHFLGCHGLCPGVQLSVIPKRSAFSPEEPVGSRTGVDRCASQLYATTVLLERQNMEPASGGGHLGAGQS